MTQPLQNIHQFSTIASTSRTGISAFSTIALSELKSPPLPQSDDKFTICALGKDVELIDNLFVGRICNNSDRIKVSPAGLVESRVFGGGRRVLCPMSMVVGLEETSVVPNHTGFKFNGMGVGEGEHWAECTAALLRRDGGCGVELALFEF